MPRITSIAVVVASLVAVPVAAVGRSAKRWKIVGRFVCLAVFPTWLVATSSAAAQTFEGAVELIRNQDYENALLILTDLAAQGDTLGQRGLGLMHQFGYGVLQDHSEAARWYRLSAEQGDTYSQANLGDLAYRGSGVPQNFSEALRWSRPSALQGDSIGLTAFLYQRYRETIA